MSATPTHWVITANLTETGAVAYRRADGAWGAAFAEAELHEDEAQARALTAEIARSQQRYLCDPYVFPVGWVDGAVDLLTTKERIRAAGPTIPLRRPDTGLPRRST